MQRQLGWGLFLVYSLLGRSDLQASLANSLCWARACSNPPTLCWCAWGQLLKEGALLTHTSVLPILASSRKGTPHAASPPEVNAQTTPNTPSSLALTFSQALSHVGVEVGDGEPISRLRYPPPEGTPSPAFCPLLFLSLPLVGLSPLFSRLMASLPSSTSRPLLVLCAGEKPVLHIPLNRNLKLPFAAQKQTLSVGYSHQSFLLLLWAGESSRNRAL